MATTDEENAWAVFLQSLAIVLVNFFDQVPPGDRTREFFLTGLDGYLGEMLNDPTANSPAVREGALALRALLDLEIEKVQMFQLPKDRPH